jgi:protein-S-isoprenylcysteine O-methyltransferase Ste14
LFSPALVPADSILNLPFDLVGWAAFLAGAVVRTWATLYVGGHKRTRLVTTGPYSICRNPLYLGSLLVALSMSAFLKSPLLLAGIGLTAVAYAHATVPCEEEELEFQHGSAYTNYCQRTRRFWPRWSSFKTPEVIESNIPGLRRELNRMLVWLWLPFICEIVNHLRSAPWWPSLVGGF